MKTRLRHRASSSSPSAEPFFGNARNGFFGARRVDTAQPFFDPAFNTRKDGGLFLSGATAPSNTLQRRLGDGHDLQSPRFAGNLRLEAAFDGEQFIRKGSRGDHVVRLQQALEDDGHPLVQFGVDGIFGSETDAAMREYQKTNGLLMDGIVGPETMGSLDARFKGEPPIPPVDVCELLPVETTAVDSQQTLFPEENLSPGLASKAAFLPHVAIPDVGQAVVCGPHPCTPLPALTTNTVDVKANSIGAAKANAPVWTGSKMLCLAQGDLFRIKKKAFDSKSGLFFVSIEIIDGVHSGETGGMQEGFVSVAFPQSITTTVQGTQGNARLKESSSALTVSSPTFKYSGRAEVQGDDTHIPDWRFGMIQTIFAPHQLEIDWAKTHCVIQVTPSLPLRDGITNPVPWFHHSARTGPFLVTGTNSGNVLSLAMDDTPSTVVPWDDSKNNGPQSLKHYKRVFNATAWVIVNDAISNKTIFLHHVSWGFDFVVAVDTSKAVTQRATNSGPGMSSSTQGNGLGGRAPILVNPVYNNSLKDICTP